MYQRIVIKIGTGVITEDERLDESVMRRIVGEIARLRKEGVEIVVVTSGAVAAGKAVVEESGVSAPARQVYAAVGQPALMNVYARLFRQEGLAPAQVLVTKEDFRDREHYASMKVSFENLLTEGIIPVVNENDVIARHTIAFSDNDELAGLIASQLDAEAVAFLTRVEGLLTETGEGAREVVPEVCLADADEFEKCVTDEKSAVGRGGMKTKFDIAKKLMRQGITTYVADGRHAGVIEDIANGKRVGTRFSPDKKLSSVKRRLAHSEGFAKGKVYVDTKAEELLLSGKSVSLLPVGVTEVEGDFKKGDIVEIWAGKRKLGAGIAQYDAVQAIESKGKKGGKVLVHYDSMFVG